MTRSRIVRGLAVVAVVAWGGAALAAEHSCVAVRVGDPILLPDGSEQAAGQLILCGGATFSPVAQFQRASVNGKMVGLFLSRPRVAEEAAGGPPVVTFMRDGEGRLLLLGYSIPSRNRTMAYVFDDAWRLVARRGAGSPWAGGATALAMVASAR